MKQEKRNQGFVALSTAVMLCAVGLLLFAALTAKSDFLLRNFHRGLLTRQAFWLSESAVERARTALAAASDPAAVVQKTFTEPIAPLYIVSDPLTENGEGQENPSKEKIASGRIIDATCRYTVRPVKDLTPFRAYVPEGKAAYRITGYAEIPYRNYLLTASTEKLCVLGSDHQWRVLPLTILE